MISYHLRRAEKAIMEKAELFAIVTTQKYMTLALCRDNVPYLVTLSYGFDAKTECFYFHCAGEGKKIEYWTANPTVWGQIIEDHGYRDGHCDHTFRSVQFRGTVTLLDNPEDKRRALHLMIDLLESDPESVKQQQLTEKAIARVTIGKVMVEGWSGKQNVK